MVKSAALCLTLTLAGCSKPEPKALQKHYAFTGTVVSINQQEHTANIDGAAIPNFMGAMKMDYPVPATSDFAVLKAGEKINGTVNVSDDGSYTLSDVHIPNNSEPGK